MNHRVWISAYLVAMFGGLGVHFNYFQVYFKELGFSNLQLGTVLSAIPLVAIFSCPLWGIVADSMNDPRRLLRWLIIATPLIHILLFFDSSYAICFLVCGLVAITYSPMVPIQDSLTLRAIHLHGGDYGRLRIWGSIGFVIPSFVLPLVWSRSADSHIDWTVPIVIFLVYSVIAFALSYRFPAVPPLRSHGISLAGFQLFRNRTFVVLVGAVFLSRLAHCALEGFQSVYFEEVGIDVENIGLFLSLGPLSEIVTIFYSQRWMVRVGARKLMALCMAALVLRLVVMSSAETNLALVLVQLLHCLTFGTMHVVTILVVNQLAGDTIRASAQTLVTVFSNLLARLVGLSAAGWLADQVGMQGMYAACAGVASLALAIWWIFYHDTEDTSLKDGVR